MVHWMTDCMKYPPFEYAVLYNVHVLTHWPLDIFIKFYIHDFQANFND